MEGEFEAPTRCFRGPVGPVGDWSMLCWLDLELSLTDSEKKSMDPSEEADTEADCTGKAAMLWFEQPIFKEFEEMGPAVILFEGAALHLLLVWSCILRPSLS